MRSPSRRRSGVSDGSLTLMTVPGSMRFRPHDMTLGSFSRLVALRNLLLIRLATRRGLVEPDAAWVDRLDHRLNLVEAWKAWQDLQALSPGGTRRWLRGALSMAAIAVALAKTLGLIRSMLQRWVARER